MTGSHRAPRYPLEGVVSWNLTNACNYRCSYCTQRDKADRHAHAEQVPALVSALCALPGDWEVKLSGGEPFVHPGFADVVAGLAAGGVRVSVVTNLSASPTQLARFAALTAARPGLLSASLHLERVDPAAFLEKLLAFTADYAGRAQATCVATRAVLPRLPALVAQFHVQGVALRVQPEKQQRDVIVYTADEERQLLALGGHNGSGHIAPDLSGRLCWAGARYFVLDPIGEAWRCYPARRYRKERLGNLLQPGFSLFPGPTPCPYPYCNCTVPQQRGLVDIRSL